ncbi:MAG: NAD(P)H-hydrate dehydratase, partial [Chlamydiota bacterium]
YGRSEIPFTKSYKRRKVVMLLSGYKVCSPQEMSRVESLFLSKGFLEEDLMKKAGIEVAKSAMHFIKEHGLSHRVVLLIGKGKNGGDAYAAGEFLLKNQFSVIAFHLFPSEETNPLCSLFCDRFQKKGGEVVFLTSEKELVLSKNSLMIDGLFGTGFHGKLEGLPLAIVKKVNQSSVFVLSIDIPSGVDGESGKVLTDAIHATKTLFLTLPKTGFFLEQGWNYVGELEGASIGYPEAFVQEIKEDGFLLDRKKIGTLLPPVIRIRHKYEAGYVLGVGGSMKGALALAGYAALRAGCGIVRLFSSTESKRGPLELIWDTLDLAKILEEMKRASVLFIGPGMGRDKDKKELFFSLMQKRTVPMVLDADALFFLSTEDIELSSDIILTPHRMEMLRLLGVKENIEDKKLMAMTQEYVERKGCILVLKGAVNWIFQKQIKPFLVVGGDPGMATAGSGDVLTGVIASFVAQGLSSLDGALVGTSIHSLSGEMAAKKKSSYSLIASDLIETLPDVFFSLRDK